jgi:hypothetical protein
MGVNAITQPFTFDMHDHLRRLDAALNRIQHAMSRQ